MKKALSLLLAVLMAAFAAGAAAESGYVELKARDIVLNYNSETLGCRFEDSDYYGLIRPDGTEVIPAVYRSMRSDSYTPYFRVEANSSDGVHDEGVIDDQGNVLVPAVYADINIVSDRWMYGVKLVTSTADDKDYTFTNFSTGDKSFYRIDTVDFYFRGKLVGTLGRSDFDSYPSAYGDYICIQKRDKTRVYYNSAFEKSPSGADSYGEYDTSYKKGKTTYIHNGSGQTAFDSGCTLTPEEVDQSIVYDQGKFFDLQGNEPFKAAQNYDYMNQFRGGYAVVKMNRLSGLVDMTGKEVIPVEYDDVGDYTDYPFRHGVISAVKDGKFGYLDQSGNVTCDFTYSKDIVRNYGSLATIKDLDGSIIVLSGLVGVLPEHYAEVDVRMGARAFVAKNAEGEYSLIDLDGTTLIPYVDCYSIYCNYDATVAAVNLGSRQWLIYTFTHDASAAPEAQPEGTETATDNTEPSDQNADSASAADGTWTCSNGHEGNTGKFCPVCGEAKPADEIICPSCGTHYAPDEAPNFCPEDGTKLN